MEPINQLLEQVRDEDLPKPVFRTINDSGSLVGALVFHLPAPKNQQEVLLRRYQRKVLERIQAIASQLTESFDPDFTPPKRYISPSLRGTLPEPTNVDDVC
jgi:hypothetical protein